MRDSNFRAVTTNKASLTITLSMYDRRALDVPLDKPLVNSLNYLTYLVSSSPKVRDTLANDGGIERLIEILHECHQSLFTTRDSIFNLEKKVLTAWKWTLAFQCLVLVGTRGTEKIRRKVVLAGILPIIATVLDNYLTLNELLWKQGLLVLGLLLSQTPTAPPAPEEFSLANLAIPLFSAQQTPAPELNLVLKLDTVDYGSRLTSDDYEDLLVEQLLKLIGNNEAGYTNDVRRRYLIANIMQKLRDKKESDVLDTEDGHYDMDVHLQFLSDLYLESGLYLSLLPSRSSSVPATKMVVRNFTETGVIIPRDDDIIWSLQLLAYISKYPYLKEELQNTHLIIDMSIRDKHFKLYLEKQRKLTLKKTLEISLRPTLAPKLQKMRAKQLRQPDDTVAPLEEELEFSVLEELESEPELDSLAVPPPIPMEEPVVTPARLLVLLTLYDEITNAELIENGLERAYMLCQVTEKVDEAVVGEAKRLKTSIMTKRLDTKQALNKKWEYDQYNGFDIDDPEDQDELLVEYKRVNLFPLVERFTFLPGTDMYYWLGVIMRNLCRRNEARGGVRQCGNLECGRWERYPREFSKCRRCKRTKYCSRDCQIKAWNCHRNWCIPSTLSGASTEITAASLETTATQGRDGESPADE